MVAVPKLCQQFLEFGRVAVDVTDDVVFMVHNGFVRASTCVSSVIGSPEAERHG